jgi:autophagy-related protein 9
MELPGMAADELLIEEHNYKRHEFHVKNLDRFFTSMYQYYRAKGLPAIILQQFCAVMSLLFTVSFSVFLLAYVDWRNLRDCKDENTCSGSFLYERPLFLRPSSLYRFTVLAYTVLFTSFWLWRCIAAIHLVSSAISMERFYRDKLGLRLSDLTDMHWHEIVQRLIRLHEHGVYRVAIKDKLTEMDIVLRVMRKDNYMIGLINKQLLGEFAY